MDKDIWVNVKSRLPNPKIDKNREGDPVYLFLDNTGNEVLKEFKDYETFKNEIEELGLTHWLNRKNVTHVNNSEEWYSYRSYIIECKNFNLTPIDYKEYLNKIKEGNSVI